MILTVPVTNKIQAEIIYKIGQDCLGEENWSLQQYIDEIDRGNIFLCTVYKSEPIGFIQCDVVYDSANLNLIAVDPDFRRQNIAARLIQTAEEILREYKTAEDFDAVVFSLEVRSENTSAQNLYQKCGFAKAGLRRNFYQDPPDDAVIYTKEL